MDIDSLLTPSLVLNIDSLERNVERMADDCAKARIALRPHAKAHKSPWVAAHQIKRGAVGICAATIGEAEVMMHAGITDVLITTTLNPKLSERVVQLVTLGEVSVVVDDATVVRSLGKHARTRSVEIPVLVDVNVGGNRTGVEPGEPAVRLARAIADTPGLRFIGLQGYEGHVQHIMEVNRRHTVAQQAYSKLQQTRDAIESFGLRVELITGAGTGSYQLAIDSALVTEVQPGSYVVMDSNYGLVRGLKFENALFVASRVLSANRPDQVIVDLGLKGVSIDSGPPIVRDCPSASYQPAGDEHGRITGLINRYKPGDLIWLTPSHCDTTVNLHDRYMLIHDDGTFDGELPISARRRAQ